jgi:transposase-like protein
MREKQQRRHFGAAQKVAIVRRHLIDGVSIADLCDEHHLQPTQVYQWQTQLFENGEAAFECKPKPGRKTADERKIAQLEEKLATKNEVIAELMEENVKAKKANGEL